MNVDLLMYSVSKKKQQCGVWLKEKTDRGAAPLRLNVVRQKARQQGGEINK